MGFVPIGTTDGSDWHGKMREVEIAAGVADVFVGDMMTLSGTGSADGRAEGVALATAGNATAFAAVGTTNLAGAIVGFTPDFTDEGSLSRNFHLTGAIQRAKLVYGSQVVYEAPATTVGLELIDIGSNKNIVVGAGSTVTGVSIHGINGTDVAAVDLGQVRILGASRLENSQVITDIGALWRCTINGSVDQQRTDGA